jgi:glycosyltransferase involved in cell wall biosynthesis
MDGSRPLRVLHCPTDTGGNAWTLAQAEKRLGLDSDVMVLRSSVFAYRSDVDLEFDRRGKLGKGTALLSFLARAASHYDVFHFNFGMSLLQGLPPAFGPFRRADLPLLRALGKVVVVTYQGCDVRQKGRCCSEFEVNACSESECPVEICSDAIDDQRAKFAANFDRYAHAIYALNPDLLHFLPERARFLPYTAVDPTAWEAVPARPLARGDRIRVVHSPTNRGIKGTRHVIEAMDAVRRVHPNMELTLVEGLPHAEVRKIYESADVAIDQLLIGWYGAFAVEAMSLGKPVICYVREEDLHFISDDMRRALPLLNANPSTIYDVLMRIAENPETLVDAGLNSRRFVLEYHGPLKIAEGVRDTYLRALSNPRAAQNVSKGA